MVTKNARPQERFQGQKSAICSPEPEGLAFLPLFHEVEERVGERRRVFPMPPLSGSLPARPSRKERDGSHKFVPSAVCSLPPHLIHPSCRSAASIFAPIRTFALPVAWSSSAAAQYS